MAGPQVFTASVLVPVSSPPIDKGSVVVDGEAIVAVGEREAILRMYPDFPETQLAGVVTPGLVNAHTHLQFTGFAHIGAASHTGFEQWSVAFDAEYSTNGATEDWYGAAISGAEMALASGTTAVADVCTDFHASSALGDAGLSGVVYLEALGDTWRQWEREGRNDFLALFEAARRLETDRVRIGISPHAPYSLDTRVLKDLAAVGKARGVRIHTHLAESAYEEEYTRYGTGPLADFVAGFGRDFQILLDRGAAMGVAEFARSIGLLGSTTHVAHGIYLDPVGRAVLRAEGTAVALCPRSNAVIGLQPPPVAAYLEEGNPIAVGTDSLSSSPSLDLLEDLRLLHGLALEQGYEGDGLARRLLNAATMGGATAIGLDAADGSGVGSLEPGKRADLAVFEVDACATSAEERLVLEGAGQCTATVIGGKVRRRDQSG